MTMWGMRIVFYNLACSLTQKMVNYLISVNLKLGLAQEMVPSYRGVECWWIVDDVKYVRSTTYFTGSHIQLPFPRPAVFYLFNVVLWSCLSCIANTNFMFHSITTHAATASLAWGSPNSRMHQWLQHKSEKAIRSWWRNFRGVYG